MRPTVLRRPIVLASAFALLFSPAAPLVWAGPPFAEFVDPNPAAGNQFGATVLPLNTGNVVITSPFDDAGGTDAGAAYLFNGATGALISTLRGSTINDNVGSGGVVALGNGNYVVLSTSWDGAAADVGAVTWANGTTGISGTVSASNSLVGATPSDQTGSGGVTIVANGNYVVKSPLWDNVGSLNAGAVTWANGTTGISGTVSASNSLVGSTPSDGVSWGDQVGSLGVRTVANGNYVVSSPMWRDYLGAVTWGNGTSGISGTVSAANSLVGSRAMDQVGTQVKILSNGNYVVSSPNWDNGAAMDAGAVTWGSGTSGVVGAVSASNSLVGSAAGDQIGFDAFPSVAATGNSYVVSSPNWDNGVVTDAGAVTWGDGAIGVAGVVSASNSLVGSTIGDRVGSILSVATLSNGNYVVGSPSWDDGAVTNAGAATWVNGTTGLTGPVSASNSLVGSTVGDGVGVRVAALSNGNYVVSSPNWNNGLATTAGAATWGNGTTGISGPVRVSNSLVGTGTGNRVGGFVVPLPNGNYVVLSPRWDNEVATDVGAVTWGNGTTGINGAVDESNSLVGTTAGDQVGAPGDSVNAVAGGYVVRSPTWDNGVVVDAGAVTWGNGATGVSGTVSAGNSLVGSTAGDGVGLGNFLSIRLLVNGNQATGNYLVVNTKWDNGAATDAGAVTWRSGSAGENGAVSASNSFVGVKAGDATGLAVTSLTNGNYLVISPGWDNGGTVDAGAVTWGNGAVGLTGTAGGSASLVGTTAGDGVGLSVTTLANGNYVVRSPGRDNAGVADAGAVTWGNGMTGVGGAVSESNSLVGAVASTNLQPVVADDVNGTFFGRFLAEGGGRVRLGSQIDGITTIMLPTITSPTSTGISGTGATLGGNVTSDGSSPITQRGVVYSVTVTNANPLIGGAGVTTSTVVGTTGLFTSGVTGLVPGTSYSLKAFATNAVGTSYTSVATFTTTALLPTSQTVCPSGCDKTKIQDAIDASAPGGSILVKSTYDSMAAGEVFPIQTLAINQAGAITITGETDGALNPITTVKTKSGPVDGFNIVSPGSVLKDLKIVPGDATRVDRVITASRNPGSCPGATCHLNGLTIQNVVIDFTVIGGTTTSHFNTGNAIDLSAENVLIDKVTIKGIAGNSIFVDGDNYTIQNSTMDGRDGTAIRGALAIGFGADQKLGGVACSGFPTNYVIKNNAIVGYKDGVRWCTGKTNTVSNNTITDISGRGIDTSGSQGTQIFGNILQQNTTAATHGIGLSTNAFQTCTGNIVRNNKVLGRAARDMQRGIGVLSCLETTIFQNEVRDFADSAIDVSMAAGVATKTTIQGNTVIGGNAAGIVYMGADSGATAVDQSVIRDNVVNEFNRDGIVVQGIKGVRSGAGAGNVVAYNTVRAANQGSVTNTHAFNLQNLANTAFDRNTALDTKAGYGFFLANSTGVNGNCNTGSTNGAGLFGQVNVTPTYGNANVNCRAALYSHYDFDGDGKSDVTMYRHTTGQWFIRNSGNGADSVIAFGAPGSDDIPAPGNYTTPGKTELAIYRYTTGEWLIRRATDGGTTVIKYGSPLVGDVPMPADYDGDGLTDLAVFRVSTANAEWYIRKSSDGLTQYVAWGCAACADVGVPGDYDGDGKADVAVYRRSTGEWFIRKSTDTTLQQVPFGIPAQGDLPVPGRYTQTSKTDMAVYRSLTGEWFIRRSTDFGTTTVNFGSPAAGDFPVPADFTQGGITDIAVYRPTPPTAMFRIRKSTDFSLLTIPYGNPGAQDAPLTAR